MSMVAGLTHIQSKYISKTSHLLFHLVAAQSRGSVSEADQTARGAAGEGESAAANTNK